MAKRSLLGIVLTGVALAASAGYVVKVPDHFPPMPIPDDNPMTIAKVELGRQLFYDKRLSSDNSVACASCHKQEYAFSDGGHAVSTGVEGRKGTRNAPSLADVGYRDKLFWEGGSPRLETQAIGPLTDPNEMNMDPAALEAKLRAIPEYQTAFKAVFPDGITMLNIAKALSAFERTLVSANSPWDRYREGDLTALSPAALRGMQLFFSERGDCFHCHNGQDFTDDSLRNTALATVYEDIGLARITGKDEDVGKFKVPTLRNVELTAPYMHDGSFKTLREVVEHYNNGGQANLNADPLMRPLGLSEAEVDDLVEFLKALTDRSFTQDPRFAPPSPAASR
ncbi:cytochrome-c peroxidase [Meiothermus granaticius]|uniref:Methylamine utilization protein MauG n=1 Tax=Meiothermus granaticius NBRC 107808 TaxID=1227551 RepID=A0A399FBD0_9DEIN|nr:cytochrome c peroxidase [Meiothermus granaticius]RIH92996.1 Cytochrome c551 peroxidase [Meiothermus granaticius NBRC 107808]GEM86166.1 methylamine utilization protein [Meiothermus granaticius NBRC 107808]